MKPKHYALLALAVWGAVVGWVGSMILAKPQAFPAYAADADGMAAAQVQQQVALAGRAAEALARLREVPPALPSGPLVALPPPPPPGTATPDGAAIVAAPVPRVVSLIVSGEGLRPRAMIDGVLVGTGATLPDGAVVRSIGPRAVRLVDADGKAVTLALRTPGDPPAEEAPKP